MTALELLSAVRGRFSVLLVEEPQQLQLLTTALGTYQDLAGFIKRVKVTERAPLKAPADFLAPVLCTDKRGDFVPHELDFDAETSAVMIGFDDARSAYPLSFTYLVNLRTIDHDTYQIPATIIGMVQDYLEVLISIPNDERMARIQEAGKLDVSRTPTSDAREGQLAAMREAMKAQRAILPMITIQPF